MCGVSFFANLNNESSNLQSKSGPNVHVHFKTGETVDIFIITVEISLLLKFLSFHVTFNTRLAPSGHAILC